MSHIFISYRRADSRKDAGRIYDRLVEAFGKPNVFKDVDDIPMGRDFRGVLREAVAQCDVQLVIIGKSWLTITDEKGQRRLDNPGDFVRIEVETALQRDHCLVIPVLVDNASMPGADELPLELRELAFKNATPVRDDPDFHNDVTKIIRSLGGTASPTKPAAVFDVHEAISRFYRAMDDHQWDVARALLAEIRASGTAPRVFNADAHESEIWAALEAEERDKEYEVLRLMARRSNPVGIWDALQVFWQSYPAYDPDNLARFQPASSSTDPIQRARAFKGNRNRDWEPYIATFTDLPIADLPFCLVPIGTFNMGSDDGHYNNEKPVHPQTIQQPYWIAQYPVTNAQWKTAVAAGAVKQPHKIGNALKWYNDPAMSARPVVGIDWFMARDFAAWTGCRLPTELEWEYAARGVESLRYPWGDDWKPDIPVWSQNSGLKPAVVTTGSKGTSWVGAFHLIGNVWEWTSSEFKAYPYRSDDGRERDTGNSIDVHRVLRGGSWSGNLTIDLRAGYRRRVTPDDRHYIHGFRCARSPK
ncbi:MAG: SUMF1/EgtB/PvdO family nonheme iron enzyme [Anaerolineae bacterium]|nr:SUMF1/EgtB/PvdO family nonheme iron enzyme [Anaerolineae bacterium]